jgi:hypothetical protein
VASLGIFTRASFYRPTRATLEKRRTFFAVAFWPQRGLLAGGKKKRSFFGTAFRRPYEGQRWPPQTQAVGGARRRRLHWRIRDMTEMKD